MGRHMAGEVGRCRAHGLVGPGKKLGASAVQGPRARAPHFNHDLLLFFFRVGLCSHRTYLLQVTWTDDKHWIPSGRRRSRGPESTRSSIRHVREICFK